MAHRPDIAVYGYARSGKDTIAEHLITAHGYVKVAFADPLRAVMLSTNPIVGFEEGQDYEIKIVRYSEVLLNIGYEAAKDQYPEIRRLLQAHGVGIREHVDPDAWVDAALRTIRRVPSGTPIVVTDCRFANEFSALDEMGFEFVRVLRDGQTNRDQHVSETELDNQKPDHTVRNDGVNLLDLRNRVDELLQDLT